MPTYDLTIDDSSPFIAFDGLWSDTQDDPSYVRYLNQTFHATQGSEASASFSFNGTGVSLYGAMRDNHGTYTVEVDGKVVANNNGFGNDVYQALLYSKTDLPYGLHNVILTNTGAPSWLDLDFVTITTGDGRPNTASKDMVLDDTEFTYDTNWINGFDQSSDASTYAGNTNHQTNVSHATARIPFNGNAIKLYGATGPDHGTFSVSLDGAVARNYNGTAPLFRSQILLCQFSGLGDGDHTLKVENLSNQPLDLDQAVISSYTDTGTASTTSQPDSEATALQSSAGSPLPHAVSSAIIGSVIGVIIFLLLFCFGLLYIRRHRKATATTKGHGSVEEVNTGGLSRSTIQQDAVTPFLYPHDLPPSYDASADPNTDGASPHPSSIPQSKRTYMAA